jgi:hypothetical protein
MSYQQYPCTICGKGGHQASRCKELAPPPPDSFYKPAPGQHQHDEDCEDAITGCYRQREDCEDAITGCYRQRDDEDESLHIHIAQLKYSYTKWMKSVLRANQARKFSSP